MTTILLRLTDLLGTPLALWKIALPLVLLATLGASLYYRDYRNTEKLQYPSLARWQYAVIALFVALLCCRYATIFEEILLRPLFPWDAWMNWAPKAIVWDHYREMVPFADQATWLAAPADATTYIEGAKNAWRYPVGVPLIQLWHMLAQGTADSTLIYLSWGLAALASGLLIFGHLRLALVHIVACLVACYAFLSLPFVNVHAALAGYADLWVTLVYGAAVLSLYQFARSGHVQWAILTLIYSIFCIQLKMPGLILATITISMLAISSVKLSPKALIWMLGASAALMVLLAAIRPDVNIPGIGRLALANGEIILPYIGRHELLFHNVTPALMETLFEMINWHLLWYLAIPIIVVGAYKNRSDIPLFYLALTLLATLGFIVSVYYFTNRYEFALDYTQVNRALIYATIPMVFIVGLILGKPSPKTNET
ncbi:hypothetical protein EY643_01745 [Halioglobus maricola]|uniref:Glycosyltransferase RgtA/B/C/D-like domain-containing protein n=1 Tax=Halioglobus maricola TaxID=2601894 RepID=A0A5P9NG24_9GAMM|nr:hypothetical protein [Halioglobus maricola]QFU74479.1 hypothetical protein EY643_01745 [Halioglobus maricola]